METWLIIAINILWGIASLLFLIMMIGLIENIQKNSVYKRPKYRMTTWAVAFMWMYVLFTTFWWSWMFYG